MHRLFAAIRPSEHIRDALVDAMDDSPELRWVPDENLHLTLRFIGEVERPLGEDIATQLAQIRFEAFDLELAGTTTDRLGHEAYVFETPPSDVDLVDRLLVSPSGHILATETVWVGHDRTDIPSPSVVSYYAWEGRA